MGSPRNETARGTDETRHDERIKRHFSVAAKAVTVRQFLRFATEFDVSKIARNAPERDCPVLQMNWYQAAAYCNWLSEKEGLPKTEWCYEPNNAGRYEEGMKPLPDFLNRTGYRLPTEAEWEYACRAGARSSRYYGQSDELLSRYAWYLSIADDRSWPVGRKKPNDFGMFDMCANAWQWCHDAYAPYPQVETGKLTDDAGNISVVDDKSKRVLRGGSFATHPGNVRSAGRIWDLALNTWTSYGFRVARTFR
jgi:formylglycine-generating enzyme required for sulfatase activity